VGVAVNKTPYTLFSTKKGINLLYIVFSNILENTDRMDIGLIIFDIMDVPPFIHRYYFCYFQSVWESA
jgi:hypothetical protein